VFCVRMAIGAERTEERDIDRALTLIEEEGRVALREWERIQIEAGVRLYCQWVTVDVGALKRSCSVPISPGVCLPGQ
jgi:hypothetical protein